MEPNSGDSDLLKQVQATHSPDSREIRIKPLLCLLEDMLKNATQNEDPSDAAQVHAKAWQDSDLAVVVDELEPYVNQIANKIVTCKYSIGTPDAHSTTFAILNMLNNFSWDAKLLIVLKSFTMCYVEFLLVLLSYSSNPLVICLAILKQMPPVSIREMKRRVDEIDALLKVVLKIVKCIVELKELPVVRGDFTALMIAKEYISMVVYWTIRSIVVASLQIPFHVRMSQEPSVSSTEATELTRLIHELGNMHNQLQVQLNICYQHVAKIQDQDRVQESYQNLLRVFEESQTDNMKVLQALFDLKGDRKPLVDGATKKRVSIDVLKEKFVLLLISKLDIPKEEFFFLEYILTESPGQKKQEYTIVWLPVLDTTLSWTGKNRKKFDKLQATMPWYTICNPSLIEKGVNKFVKEMWHFKRKPMLVVLDPQGRVASPNALHLFWIWGCDYAFPFTTLREEAMWKAESHILTLELLVDGIDQVILDWIKEGKYICLYGGEDIEWIRKFTNTAQTVAGTAGIPLEMVYVGRSNPKEKVKSNISSIIAEKLSHCWQEQDLQGMSTICFFWIRIESMWRSKNQLGKTVDDDPIMQEVKTILSYDNNGDGWGILSKGSTIMVKAKGSAFLNCLSDYSAWKTDAEKKGFSEALKDHLAKLHTRHRWNPLVLPEAVEKMPATFLCTECGRPMGSFVMYRSWVSKELQK